MADERTYIMIKPDGVQRGLVGEIIKRFEQRGYHLAALKFVKPTEEQLKAHYKDLAAQPFFAGLISFMASGPVVAIVFTGLNVIKAGRVLLGETNPQNSQPGSIRGDYAIDVNRNVIHGSDSVQSAEYEIPLWFKPEELVSWTSASRPWIVQ